MTRTVINPFHPEYQSLKARCESMPIQREYHDVKKGETPSLINREHSAARRLNWYAIPMVLFWTIPLALYGFAALIEFMFTCGDEDDCQLKDVPNINEEMLR